MTSSPIPLILIGDAPTQPSGLARIGRDLARHIYTHLGQPHAAPLVQLLQIGLQSPQGALPWAGPWPLVTFSGYERMGASTLARMLKQFRSPGIVFALWDAHFSWDLQQEAQKAGWEFWIYPPVDAVNQHGVFGGPAAEVIKKADRVLAYGEWASGVLQRIRNLGDGVEGIPLGIADEWQPAATLTTDPIIGCVATNQPRKDLNLYCATLRELLDRGHDVKAWLVTDATVKRQGASWSIPELIEIHRLEATLKVFTHADGLGDKDLMELYQASSVTIAPGCGEGFGYPIVESMACGTPVVAIDYAGGAELGAWNVCPSDWRVDGPYALHRPIVHAHAIADVVELLWKSGHRANPIERYRWTNVWPRWEAWIREGLTAFREPSRIQVPV